MSAKSRNVHIQCESQERLFALKDEFENFVGRDTTYDLKTLTLTVLALPKKYKKKTVLENKLRRLRQARDAEINGYDEDPDYEDREY